MELPSQSPKFLFGKQSDKSSLEKAKAQIQKYLEVRINYWILTTVQTPTFTSIFFPVRSERRKIKRKRSSLHIPQPELGTFKNIRRTRDRIPEKKSFFVLHSL